MSQIQPEAENTGENKAIDRSDIPQEHGEESRPLTPFMHQLLGIPTDDPTEDMPPVFAPEPVSKDAVIKHLYNNGSRALVCVWTGYDDPCRGDSKGYEGIGEEIANRLNGTYMYTRQKYLDLVREFNESGYPDIILGGDIPYKWKDKLLQRGVKMIIDSWNEHLSSEFSDENLELVAHNITPQRLAEEGAVFDERHEDQIKGDLIMVAVNDNMYDYPEQFNNKMAQLLKAHDQATVYFTSSPRSDGKSYNEFVESFRAKIGQAGLTDRVNVLSFDLNAARNVHSQNTRLMGRKHPEFYNPYVGLIARADHLICDNGSYSLLSEMLAAGKTLLLYRNSWKDFAQSSYARSLVHLPNEGGLVSTPVQAPDTRSEVVSKLMGRFESAVYAALPYELQYDFMEAPFDIMDYVPDEPPQALPGRKLN